MRTPLKVLIFLLCSCVFVALNMYTASAEPALVPQQMILPGDCDFNTGTCINLTKTYFQVEQSHTEIDCQEHSIISSSESPIAIVGGQETVIKNCNIVSGSVPAIVIYNTDNAKITITDSNVSSGSDIISLVNSKNIEINVSESTFTAGDDSSFIKSSSSSVQTITARESLFEIFCSMFSVNLCNANAPLINPNGVVDIQDSTIKTSTANTQDVLLPILAYGGSTGDMTVIIENNNFEVSNSLPTAITINGNQLTSGTVVRVGYNDFSTTSNNPAIVLENLNNTHVDISNNNFDRRAISFENVHGATFSNNNAEGSTNGNTQIKLRSSSNINITKNIFENHQIFDAETSTNIIFTSNYAKTLFTSWTQSFSIFRGDKTSIQSSKIYNNILIANYEKILGYGGPYTVDATLQLGENIHGGQGISGNAYLSPYPASCNKDDQEQWVSNTYSGLCKNEFNFGSGAKQFNDPHPVFIGTLGETGRLTTEPQPIFSTKICVGLCGGSPGYVPPTGGNSGSGGNGGSGGTGNSTNSTTTSITFTTIPYAPLITNDSVQILWDTDLAGNYDITGDITSSASDFVTSRDITLTGLSENTAYSLDVEACESGGACTTETLSFTTPTGNDIIVNGTTIPGTVDGSSPTLVISNLAAYQVATDEVLIVWETNDAANSSATIDGHTQTASAQVTEHSLTVSSVSAGTHSYVVESCDITGCKNASAATDITVTNLTDTTNPSWTISPVVTATSTSTAKLEWETNEVTDYTITYGLNESSLTDTEATLLFNTSRTVTLSGLSASTSYVANVEVCDPSGKCESARVNFTTEAVSTNTGSSGSGTVGVGSGGGGSSGSGGSRIITASAIAGGGQNQDAGAESSSDNGSQENPDLETSTGGNNQLGGGLEGSIGFTADEKETAQGNAITGAAVAEGDGSGGGGWLWIVALLSLVTMLVSYSQYKKSKEIESLHKELVAAKKQHSSKDDLHKHVFTKNQP